MKSSPFKKNIRLILLIAVPALILIAVATLYSINMPEYLASDASRIPKFFGLSAESIGADKPDFCIDEMFNQGHKFEDFGSAGYLLNIPNQHGVYSDELYRHPNANVTDSALIITVRRGDINGTFTLSYDAGLGRVIYEQVY